MIDPDTPEILRQFLAYHETIKGHCHHMLFLADGRYIHGNCLVND